MTDRPHTDGSHPAAPGLTLKAVHLTASEAYPALERLFLAAEVSIRASFMVFDLATRLRSDAARKIGDTWFDLIRNTLARGVDIDISVSDVDPIARPEMHRDATRTLRMFLAASETATGTGRLTITVKRHPARTGWLIRLALWPYMLKRLRDQTTRLNRLGDKRLAPALRDLPGLARHLVPTKAGVRPRLAHLPTLSPTLHHQKLAVFDAQTLYIGGLDLNERRFDTPDHNRAADQTWHDVQLEVEGDIVALADAHLRGFQAQVNGDARPGPARPPFLRTLSVKRRFPFATFGPRPAVSELRRAHLAAIAGARQIIYLESQYFRDRTLAAALARQAARHPELRLIVVLPAAPDDVAFEGKRGLDARFGEALQARALRRLTRAFGPRVLIAAPAQRRRDADLSAGLDDRDDPARLNGAPLIYVHSKVSIFDHKTAIVSSANLNRRSLLWDSEAGLQLDNPADIARLSSRVLGHWWPDTGPGASPGAQRLSVGLFERWRHLTFANAQRAPQDREGLLLPYDIARSEAFGTMLPIVPEELV